MRKSTKFTLAALAVAAIAIGAITPFAKGATWTYPSQPVVTQVVTAAGGAQSNAATLTGKSGQAH